MKPLCIKCRDLVMRVQNRWWQLHPIGFYILTHHYGLDHENYSIDHEALGISQNTILP